MAGYLLAGAWLIGFVFTLATAVSCGRRAEATAWYGLAAGFLLAGIAQTADALRFSASGSRPEPAIVELVRLAAYPAWLFGGVKLTGLVRRYRVEPARSLDAVAITLAVVFVEWNLVKGALADAVGGSLGSGVLGLAPPAVYLAVLFAFGAAVASGIYPRAGTALLGLGLLSLAGGNLLSLHLRATPPGHVHELLFVAVPLLLAAAAIERRRRPDGRPAAERELPHAVQVTIPLIATLPVIAVAAVLVSHGAISLAHLISASAAVIAVDLRLIGRSFEANRRFEEAAWATWYAQQATREQEALIQAATTVSSSLDRDEIFTTVVEELSTLLDTSHSALMEQTPDGRWVVKVSSTMREDVGAELRADQGMLAMVLRHQGTVITDGDAWRATQADWVNKAPVENVRVAMGIPVRWQREIRGVLLAARSDADRFEPSETRVAEAFAEFAGMAMGHAETLAGEREQRRLSEQRMREQVALIQASKSINSELGFEEVGRRLVASAGELLGADRFALSVLRDGGQAELVVAVGYEWVATGALVPADAGLAGRVLDSGKRISCDAAQWRSLLEGSGWDGSDLDGGAIALPVRWQGRVRAVMEFGLTAGGPALGAEEVRVLETFAELLGLAFGNSETLAAEQRRREQSELRLREEEALIAAAKTISTTLETDEVMARIADQMRELVGADRAGLNLVADDGRVQIMVPLDGSKALVGRHLPPGAGLSGLVLEQGRTVVVNDGLWSGVPEAGVAQAELLAMRAAIAAPVRLRGKIRAVLLVAYRGDGVRIDAEQVRVVEAFAELAAVALGNAQTLAQARQSEAESRALREAAAELVGQQDSEAVLKRLVARSCDLLGADAAAIDQLDDDLCTRVRHATGMSTDAWREMIIPPGKGLSAAVVDRDAPLAIEGLGEDFEHDPANFPLLSIERLRWVVGVPMSYGGRPRGALVVGFRRPHRFTPAEIDLVQGLANQASVAMDTARLLEERESANAELRVRLRATIDALASTLEARDGYTGAHSIGVTLLVEAVARRMGTAEEDLAELRAAAKLHDIGKLGIPNEILRKEGPLEPDEWAVMYEHPAIGERILAGVPGLENVARAVRHEHEHFDGSGYPDGLAGEAIPLASRIILACDAFHAMTSDRPYRAALPRKQALMELARCAGAEFDPVVVEALFAELHWGPDVPSELEGIPGWQ